VVQPEGDAADVTPYENGGLVPTRGVGAPASPCPAPAVASILTAAVYLLFSQNLSFPRKQHEIVTGYTALVNITVLLILVLGMVGLFALVWGIMLVIELVVFPPNLMSDWPNLEDPTVGFVDLGRTGAFISTIGVLSGALAGGLENRAIVSHLALFLDRP